MQRSAGEVDAAPEPPEPPAGHQGASAQSACAHGPSGGFPTGLVVANEADPERAKLGLAGRLRHLTTPCCAITIGKAQNLPLVAFANRCRH